MENFVDASASEAWVDMPADALAELLESDVLQIGDEASAFRALVRWHAAQTPAPSDAFEERLMRTLTGAEATDALL